ncbi:MAG: DUF484 family protein [Porticoccaceae bacterium]|jgi:hypothetical protein|nr:DUF484 family protein [Porticoccaceae bacterium]MBT3798912.1 DUF484 family protein [Porticoccaceae bacterium]MBT4211492.1 DUF484 family protein [Porticoccaceae bacterium]MBT5004334.1 DUF484 family protein [Porticoccaceae bacterium]MBT5102722.1 DUF484 family protein [Porticoccaceae bacterium]
MSTEKPTDISVKQVRGYLRDHPTFFDENPDILETMIVPHNTEGAVSLIERQLAVLRSRNSEMKEQLDSLYSAAQENEIMFEKTNHLISGLLEANNLGALIESLYESLATDYGVEAYSLTLFGDEMNLPKSMAQISSPDKANKAIASILLSSRAVCGQLGASEMSFLFGDHQDVLGSAATVVLGQDSKLGVLALGNSDPHFYQTGMGTIFLDYLAEVLSRLLPQYLKSRNKRKK